MNPSLDVKPHPMLDFAALVTEFPTPLGELTTPAELWALLSLSASAPLKSDELTREAIRALLRHGGFKPSGRSKPASEYLLRAVGEGTLSSINLAVDVCNIVSLHSGLPISVVDLDKTDGPLAIDMATVGTSYVFNAGGQTIEVGGLLCLGDSQGPCANAVKDAQRTKTSAATSRTFSVIWGSRQLPGRTEATCRWYRALLEQTGATTRSMNA